VYNIGNLTIKKTQNELDKNSKDNYKLLLEIKKLRDELEKDIKKAHLVEQNIQEQELTLFNKNNTDSFEYRSIW
jgi:dsDNA-binding SOS-regulon protein